LWGPFGPSSTVPGSAYPFTPPFGSRVPQYPSPLRELLCPLLTSVPRSKSLTTPSPPFLRGTSQTSRGKFDRLHRTPAEFTAIALDGYGLRDHLLTRPAIPASYPVPVRRVAALLHASFRPRLTTTPLRFASTSPPSGCAGDFHPQAVKHARHTRVGGGVSPAVLPHHRAYGSVHGGSV